MALGFVQFVELYSDKTATELLRLEDEWRAATRGRRTALLELFLTDRSDPDRKLAVNGYESYDQAMVNSYLPETSALAAQLGEAISGVLAFREYDVLDQMAEERDGLADRFSLALATGVLEEHTVTEDVLVDMNVPQWRFQIQGAGPLREALAVTQPGGVESASVTPTFGGFVLEVVVRAPDPHGYMSRMLCLCQVHGGLISQATCYSTGNWDADSEAAHAKQVHLPRP